MTGDATVTLVAAPSGTTATFPVTVTAGDSARPGKGNAAERPGKGNQLGERPGAADGRPGVGNDTKVRPGVGNNK